MRSLRSPLGRVLGYGSAKEGVNHWWVQRMTSVALIPLGLWFVISLLTLPSLDYTTVTQWMSGAWTALLLLLLLLIGTWHSRLGVQVIVEDYVHGGLKTVTLMLVAFVHFLVAVTGTFAVLKVAFGGAA